MKRTLSLLKRLAPAMHVARQQHGNRRLLFPSLATALALLVLGGGGVLYYVHVDTNARLQAHAMATATSYARATATTDADTPQAIYNNAIHAQRALFDELANGENSYWKVSTASSGGCVFEGGAYHVSALEAHHSDYCYTWPTFDNFAFQVQMTILRGDTGGIVFRADPAVSTFYLFSISQNGTYRLALYPDANPADVQNLTGGATSAIQIGLNQPNQVTIIARGSVLYLFINAHYLATVNNGVFTSGRVGLLATDQIHPTEVAYSDAQIWNV